jgi:hypothetical protein
MVVVVSVIMDLKVFGLRARVYARTAIRLLGLIAVLIGTYHLLFSFIDPSLPTWAPWRVIGVTASPDSGGIYYLGDVLVIAVGAIVTWFS